MLSSLAPAALVITYVCGAIQIFCILGFFALRRRTVFAIRVPEAVLMGLILRLVSFSFVAWMFASPSCPCVAASVAWWLDNVANHYTTFREWVLVFRYEIQAALEKAKLEGIANLDESNVFVRYRNILKSRWQWAVMVFLFVYLGVGYLIVNLVYMDDASTPCLMSSLPDNRAWMWTIITSFLYFPPFMVAGYFSRKRLKAFPKDNWKVYQEGANVAHVTSVVGLVHLVLIAVVQKNEYMIFWHLTSNVYLGLINFIVPLILWRRSVQQIAKQGLMHLASLSRLLKEPEFLIAFNTFLKSEFCGETLYFWMEANRIMQTYQSLLPLDVEYEGSGTPASDTPSSTPHSIQETVEVSLVPAAARELLHLTEQCIGENAPWQVNISGYTGHDVEVATTRVSECLHMQVSEHQLQELQSAVEDMFRCFVTAQAEVYEVMRKDPYPRFLLTPLFDQLDKNDNLKQILAAENIELHSTHSPKDLAVSSNNDGNGRHGYGESVSNSRRNTTHDSSSPNRLDRRIAAMLDNENNSNRGGSKLNIIDDTNGNRNSSSSNNNKGGVASHRSSFIETTIPVPMSCTRGGSKLNIVVDDTHNSGGSSNNKGSVASHRSSFIETTIPVPNSWEKQIIVLNPPKFVD